MNAFIVLTIIVHMIASVGLIVFILLHSGKGTGLSSMLGAALPTTSTGTGIIEKNLDRITIGLAVVFTITLLILMIGYAPGA